MNEHSTHIGSNSVSPDTRGSAFDHGMLMQILLAVVFLIGTAVLQYTVDVLDATLPEGGAAYTHEGIMQASALYRGDGEDVLRITQVNRPVFQVRNMRNTQPYGDLCVAALPLSVQRGGTPQRPAGFHGPVFESSSAASNRTLRY